MPQLILPVASRALVTACRELGLDPRPWLEQVGLTERALYQPDLRIPARVGDQLWQAAVEATLEPALGVRVALATAFGTFRVLDYLGSSASTLGEGLARVATYFPLIDPRGRLQVVARPDGTVELQFEGTDGRVLAPAAQEYTLTLLSMRARHAAGQQGQVSGVSFTFAAPRSTTVYERALSVRPRFGARVAALHFGQAAWAAPVQSADPALFATLDAFAREASAQANGDPLVSTLQRVLSESLVGRAPRLAVLARRVNSSPRTLQRRLEAAGTSFEQLVDEVRRARAEQLLAGGDVAMAEVSWLLGFAEQSAFARAFKRWHGLSPTRWRAQQKPRSL